MHISRIIPSVKRASDTEDVDELPYVRFESVRESMTSAVAESIELEKYNGASKWNAVRILAYDDVGIPRSVQISHLRIRFVGCNHVLNALTLSFCMSFRAICGVTSTAL